MWKIPLLVIIICILLQSLKYNELFTEKHILVDNKDNVKGSINLNKNTFHNILLSIEKTGVIDKSLYPYNSNIILYIDPYINNYVFLNNNNQDYTDGIFLCLTPNKLGIADTLWHLENKIIAYNFISDYLFIQAIIKAYRLDENKIKLIKINTNDLYSYDVKYDYFITYIVLNSEYMKIIEKSHLYINGFIDIDINKILPFYPFIRNNVKTLKDYFINPETKNYINNKESNVIIPLMNLKKIEFREKFITRLDINEDYNKEGYGCYGDIDVYNKYACNSQYNIIGEPKDYYSIWDKKCTLDTECPYFKSNINYPNNRGGCVNGTCEYPVGINRIGFTKMEDINKYPPFCYGCDKGINCCKLQKKPDYVFPNDYLDRKKYKLITILEPLNYHNY